MIKIPNYDVIVPVVPDLQMYAKRRTTADADRKHLVVERAVSNTTIVQLPWAATNPNWVEVYLDGIRVVNPPIPGRGPTSIYEVFNIKNNVIKFVRPVTGQLKIICDTQAVQHWSSLIIDPQNVQSHFVYKDLENFEFKNWPVKGGYAKGTIYKVNYEPGVDFFTGSNVTIKNCEPKDFNGTYQVINSTLGTVTFMGKPTGSTHITVRGTITGYGNGVVKSNQGIGLYCEPVILTQPQHGYARLTADRQKIAYVPNSGYTGNDAFSWALMTQNGQIGSPKCLQIKVLP